MALVVAREDPGAPDISALLARHHDLMRALTPAVESCHVLTPEALLDRGAQLFACREGADLLGVGAVQMIAPDHAEIKSMHTAPGMRGRGVARLILRHLLDAARDACAARASLETGSADAFAAARALYASEGFALCPPFGGYRSDPLSVFMSRAL